MITLIQKALHFLVCKTVGKQFDFILKLNIHFVILKSGLILSFNIKEGAKRFKFETNFRISTEKESGNNQEDLLNATNDPTDCEESHDLSLILSLVFSDSKILLVECIIILLSPFACKF